MMQTSLNGRRLIEQFEGKRLMAYRDQVGVLTIGYGDTNAAGGFRFLKGHDIMPNSVITLDEADQIMAHDLGLFEPFVISAIGKATLTQNQFDACVSLAFNIGGERFKRSTVAERIRAGDMHGAANAFLMFVKAGGRFNQGLLNRRHAEVTLFNGYDKHVGVMAANHTDMEFERVFPDTAVA